LKSVSLTRKRFASGRFRSCDESPTNYWMNALAFHEKAGRCQQLL
jgi:hypothetical protein